MDWFLNVLSYFCICFLKQIRGLCVGVNFLPIGGHYQSAHTEINTKICIYLYRLILVHLMAYKFSRSFAGRICSCGVDRQRDSWEFLAIHIERQLGKVVLIDGCGDWGVPWYLQLLWCIVQCFCYSVHAVEATTPPEAFVQHTADKQSVYSGVISQPAALCPGIPTLALSCPPPSRQLCDAHICLSASRGGTVK